MSVRLALVGLTRRYRPDREPALREVTLEVAPGELVTIMGPSGSGKSTLLALVAGLEIPDAGDVRFDDRSVLAVPAAKRSAVMVLQRPYLFPHLSVGENVTFALAAQGVGRATRRAEAVRWLEMVELDGMADRRPRELSGGEQQRVALARALAAAPAVLLLDEPLASLDPAVRGSLQAMLRSLVGRTGVTTLLVTHDLPEAVALGDRMALLQRGDLIATGTPEELYRRPPNRAAAELVGITTFIPGRLDGTTLTTAAGTLTVEPVGLAPGDVVAAVRPEHLALSSAGGIPGTVRAAVFRGTHWDVELDTALGPLRARSEVDVDIGSAAAVAIDPAGVVPLPPAG